MSTTLQIPQVGFQTSYPTVTVPADLAAYQPLDSDLTAIAALSTTTFGRALLALADAAAVRTAIGAGTSSFSGAFSALSGVPTTIAGYGITDAYTKAQVDSAVAAKAAIATTLAGYGITDAQPLDADLTAIAALATDSFGRTLLTKTDAASIRTYITLGNVENTALSTWTGAATITTLGTIATGTWQGTAVAAAYVGSLPASQITSGVFSIGRLATGTPDGTKFVRDDGTLAVPTAAVPDLVPQLRAPTTSQTIAADSCVLMQGHLRLTAGLFLKLGAGSCFKVFGA